MSYTTLILEPERYSPKALDVYSEFSNVKKVEKKPEDIANKESVKTIVCRLKYHLNIEFLSMFPNLRFIVSPTTGLNHIDLDYCKANEIDIVCLKGEDGFLDSIHSTSEHNFLLMLALVRNVVPGVKSVIESHKWDRDLFIGRELANLTLGVLGVGRIGRHMINYANAFGMSVAICDPYKDLDGLKDNTVSICSKDELFSLADIVSIHVDYRPENRDMISYREFKLMKPGSYFVNTSRGELISEEALIWALKEGILSGAALDVLSDEQNTKDFFNKQIFEYARQHDNLIITPHMGGCTLDAMMKTELFAARKFKSIIQNRKQDQVF